MRAGLIILVVLGACGAWAAGEAGNYPAIEGYSTESAVRVNSDGTTMVTSQKEYYGKDKYRFDFDTKMSGKTFSGSTIVRFDKDLQWVLMPERNAYVENSLTPDLKAKLKHDMPREMAKKFKFVGTETLNGQAVDKYDYSNEKCQSSYGYVARDSGLPVKSESTCGTDQLSVEYTNTKAGLPPDDLFEVPAGLKKMDLHQPS